MQNQVVDGAAKGGELWKVVLRDPRIMGEKGRRIVKAGIIVPEASGVVGLHELGWQDQVIDQGVKA